MTQLRYVLLDVLVQPLVLVAKKDCIVNNNPNLDFTVHQADDTAFTVASQSKLSVESNAGTVSILEAFDTVINAGINAPHCVNKMLAVSDIAETLTRANNNVVVRQTLLILSTRIARQENNPALEVDVSKIKVARLNLGVPQRYAELIFATRVARDKLCFKPIDVIDNTHYNDRVAVVKDNSSKQVLRRIVDVSVRECHVSSSTSC
jgi:hypothetical protein